MINLCTEQLAGLKFHKVFVCMCIIHTSIFIYLYKRYCTFAFLLCAVHLIGSPHLIQIFWIICLMFVYLWFQNDLKWSYWANFPESESSDWCSGKLIAEDGFRIFFKKWDPIFLFSFFLPTLHSVSNCRLPEGGECFMYFLVNCFKAQVVYPTSIY